MRTIETKQVVTYQHTYIAGETSLCDHCEKDPLVIEHFPVLGPVQHGYRNGQCDGCEYLDSVEGQHRADAYDASQY